MDNLYLAVNGWREILARVFKGFTEQPNVTPEWLVNPATKRRLKLDIYYPEAGFAVRFIGLKAKGQRRRSDWEAMEEEQREQNRVDLCRINDVQLMLINPADDTIKQLDTMTRLLSRASRVLAQGDFPESQKSRWMPALARARQRSNSLRSSIFQNPEQMMANLADAWRDREYASGGAPAPLPMPTATRIKAKDLSAGARVEHERFGPGVITKINGDGAEAMVSILFDGADERTFLITLIQDKLYFTG